jgi:hypothetical protein
MVRARAHIAAVLAALMAAGVGCGRPDAGSQSAPEAAFRAFRDALQRGDRDTVFAMLDDESRAVLEARSAAWAESGGEPLVPAAWLGVADVLVETEVETMVRVALDDTHAVLELTSWHDTTHQVDLVRVDGRWRIDLGLDEPRASEDER